MSDSKTIKEIEKLHEQASRLTSEELISGLAIALLQKDKHNPKAIFILKTYLKRALEKEGII